MDYGLGTLLVGAISGIATISIAAFAIIQAKSAETQAKAAKTQAELIKKEIDSRIRPWIAPESFTPYFRHLKDGRGLPIADAIGLQINDKSVDVDHTTYKLTVKNWGSLPVKASYRYQYGDSEITKENLKNSEINEEHQFMPNSVDELYLDIFEEIHSAGKSFWVGIEIEYVVKGKISLAGKIWKVANHRYSLMKNWVEDPFMR